MTFKNVSLCLFPRQRKREEAVFMVVKLRALKPGRLKFGFWPWFLSCVTEATCLKSVILNCFICNVYGDICPTGLLEASNEHSLCIQCLGPQYVI